MPSRILLEASKKQIRLYLKDGELAFKAPKGALTPELRQAISANKAALIELLRSHAEVSGTKQINRRDPGAPAPLSYAQQRLWLLDQIDGGNAHYNIPMALRMRGQLDYVALDQVFTNLLLRHESLRTRFVISEAGEAIQDIAPAPALHVPVRDLSVLAPAQREQEAKRHIAAEAAKGFDLANDLMLRVGLLKLAADEHILLLTMHHIASDGWSMGVLVNEFSQLYAAALAGKADPLPPLAVQYADYAKWQRDWLQGEVLDAQLDYWQRQLADLPPVHSLPLDFPRPVETSFAGANHRSRLSPASLAELNALCQRHEATLFMGLHAAFSVLLARFSNETDIVVGSPIANREQAEVANLIGFFVNTLVLRSDVSGAPSFIDLLLQSKQTLLQAYAHQQVPFEQIVERLQPVRSRSHSPLFQILLALQNNKMDELALSGLQMQILGAEDVLAKYELTLDATESSNGLELYWEYNTALFEAATITRMANCFEQLLQALLARPQANVFAHDLLQGDQREQMLMLQNNNRSPWQRDLCLHQMVQQQVLRTPDAVALICGEERLSYAELNARANQLAHYLRTQRQVGPQALVGVCMPRSLAMVVGILAILKTGAAYVPLDPEYPAARLAYMLEDTRAHTVLTVRGLATSTPVTAEQALYLDDAHFQQSLQGYPASDIACATSLVTPSDLAYIIYTSGSTGNPKGVMIEHRNAVSFLCWAHTVFSREQLGCVLASTSVCFDLSIFEMFAPLTTGGAALIVQNILALQPDMPVTLINTVPSAAEALLAGSTLPPSARTINLAGEPLKQKVVDALYLKGFDSVYDLYGPSEDTTYSTYVLRRLHGRASIGRPICNTQAFVLNAALQLAPPGVAGELLLGGAGLARGYLNRPDLTDEKFIPNPFHDPANPDSSARLYRTADLVRWLPDGNLEYLGRTDHQVKIRGFRIELGEIENALLRQGSVKDCIVVARESASGGKQLVAYVVRRTETGADAVATATDELAWLAELKQQIGVSLPEYMLPATMMVLPQLPLTPNGKVDRKALPEPVQLQDDFVAPQGELENRLAQIWQNLLGVERVGRHANFFHLGGHSLLVTRLTAAIRQSEQVNLPLKFVFQTPVLAELASVIARFKEQATLEAIPPLLPVPRQDGMPVSWAQQRLWLLDQIDGGSAHYNMPAAMRFQGVVDVSALRRALGTIVARHESLRSRFIADHDGMPQQVIDPAATVLRTDGGLELLRVDLAGIAPAEQQQQVAAHARRDAAQPFDLARDLMLRASLLHLAQDEHVLLLNLHHIAFDGWSMAILINELSALYNAYAAHLPDPLPPLSLQYADYAHWQRNWLTGAVLEQQLGYWQRQLAGLPVVHSLPLDFARPLRQTFAGDVLPSQIDVATLGALKALCQSAGATLFMGLHAAFSVLLARMSNQTDIVIGSPIANREQAEVVNLIGFFVNTLVLRADLSATDVSATDLAAQPDFNALLAQSRRTLLDAYAHQQVPFEQIVERVQSGRSLAHSPLFQVMLTLQNNERGVLHLHGLELTPLEHDGTQAKYDLSLTVMESDDGLALGWEYNTALFARESIARMAASFAQLLASLVAQPARNVFAHDMLPAGQTQQMLARQHANRAPWQRQLCLHQLLEQQAASTPDAVALLCGDERISYAELNARANQLAHYLRTQRQVGPQALVGVCMPRSLAMVVGILAILKTGAAYVPLDPEYPAARLAYMLEDTRAHTVLTVRGLAASTPVTAEQALYLDDAHFLQSLQGYPASDIACATSLVTPSDLAYIIYTSGSTGNPKGVMIEHRNAVAFLAWVHTVFNRAQLACVLASTSVCFDLSIFEMFAPLSCGGSALIVPNILALRADMPVSLINTVPSAAEALLAGTNIPASARTINLAGEPLKQKIVDALYQRGLDAVYDLYGPSEDTTYSTYVLRRLHGQASIGQPISNTQAFVLNEALQMVPQGVAGELMLGGAGLARGYLNRPDLTDEKFIANPYHDPANPDSSERLYRTADLVRWLPDGNLEYLGRIDHQVKIRGFRIELGEIESALLRQDGVQDAVVVAREAASGDKQLVAYVVPKVAPAAVAPAAVAPAAVATAAVAIAGVVADDAAAQQAVARLKQAIGQSLPEYMVPAAFVLLPQLPLTPNGKVDRKALPEPARQQAVIVSARNPSEAALVSIWCEVLHLAQVSVLDNFFQSGGHSLLALQMLSLVRQRLGVEVPMREFFVHPVLADLAQLIEQLQRGTAPRRVGNLVQLRAGQAGQTPLFVMHSGGGEVGYVHDLAPLLDPQLPLYGLAASGFLEGETPLDEVPQMASRYLQAVRQVQPAGPYRLGGWSAGGTIAWEMARQLLAAGETVQFLCMIDTTSDYQAREAGFLPDLSGTPDQIDCALLLAKMTETQQLTQTELAKLTTLAAQGEVYVMLEDGIARGMFPPGIDVATVRRHLAVRSALRRALLDYQPQALPLQPVLIMARDMQHGDLGAGWSALQQCELPLQWVAGEHYSIMKPPHIDGVAQVLNRALAQSAA